MENGMCYYCNSLSPSHTHVTYTHTHTHTHHLQSALNKDNSSFPFDSLHTVSLHSVHTLYEEMESTPTQNSHEESVVSPFGKGKDECDSGFETSTCSITGTCRCNDTSTCSNHSGNSTDNEAASYITYGSLKNIFQDQSTSHNDSNNTTSL